MLIPKSKYNKGVSMEVCIPLTETETRVQTIGSTTYIVNSSYKKDSKEGLVDKVARLIKNAVITKKQ